VKGRANVRLLLDTHAFLWWLAGDKRLTPRARRAVADEANAIFVSAASAWEVATKVRLGRLPGAEFVSQEFTEHLARQGFHGLNITVEHGQRAGSLPGPHQDPFDRMLIAQAQAENLTIVSNETVFEHYAVVRFW
jgi:PIN domain nuclease of toxin-antitoxin system